MTRREVLRAAVAGCVATCAPADPVVALAEGTRRRGRGCMLSRLDADRILRTASEQRLYATGREPMILSSGDKDFDAALAMTLARISDTFDVLPGFAYYQDAENAENAYATNVVRLKNADGTVLFGTRYLKSLRALPEHPDVAVAAVCAHEFGHIVQYKLGLDRRVNEGQPTVKRVELQADFFAGYFAGIRKRERPSFPAAVFALTQYNQGDDMKNHPDHHGTHAERGAAISRGFEAAYREKQSFSAAIEASVKYVGRM